MSKLFREKSLQRISSPEQLDAYIRVSTPSVWLLLSAIVILLTGVCVWGVFGRLDTVLPAVAAVSEGTATAYVREADADRVAAGAAVSVGGTAGRVISVSEEPVRADSVLTEYMLHVGGLQAEEWVCELALEIGCADGVHEAQIVVDSVSPMSFVLN